MTDQSATVRAFDPAKRDRLIESAASLFSRVGFEGASVDDIAAKASVAKGTVYLYFGSKADLFLAVLEQLGSSMEHHPSLPETAEAAEASLRRLIQVQLRAADEIPGHFRCYTTALFGVNRQFEPSAREIFNEQRIHVMHALGRMHRKDRGAPRLIRARASLFVGCVLAAALVRGLDSGARAKEENALIALAREPLA